MDPKLKPTAEQLAQMTPVEIDTILSDVWNRQALVEGRIVGYRRAEADTKTKIQKVKRGERVVGVLNAVHGIELMERLNLVRDNIDLDRAELAKLEAEALPYENEYVRRGAWNRVFLAQSRDGHAHNGMECSTCHNGEQRTQFAWLIQYSGKTEAEIVADAGWRACTTCYPSAPLGDEKTLPTMMFTPDEEEAAKAREEREAARARREANQTAKGITAPDGSPLRDKSSGRIATERTAVIEATDALSDRYKNLRAAQIIEADPGLTPFFLDEERRSRNEAEERSYAMRLIVSIAHKRGVTGEEVLAELEPKAYAKAKRDMGGDWPSRIRYSASFQREEYDAYLAQCEKDGRKPWEALTLRWFKL
jgi:hypothetical protein